MPDPQTQSRSRTPSQPHSPALSVSPPHEVKVRQISQGVEDMKWQQRLESQQDTGPNSQPSLAPSQDVDDTQAQIELTQAVFASQSTSGPPASSASVEEATEEAEEAEDTASSLPHTRRASESDSGEPEKGLKRKLADRATSTGPESGPSTLTPVAETAKRPRDDADKDDNPRVSKRPSPPPEQHEEPAPALVPAPETPAPKPVRILSYHSCYIHSTWSSVDLCRTLLQCPPSRLSKGKTSSRALPPTIKNRPRARLRSRFHCLRIPHPCMPPLHPHLVNRPSRHLHHLILHNQPPQAPPPNGRDSKRLRDLLPHLQPLLHFRMPGPNHRWETIRAAYSAGASLRHVGRWV